MRYHTNQFCYYTIDEETGCHLVASHKPNGRGYINIRRWWYKGQFYMHREVYEQHYGSIPKGKCVCHRCGNRHCINPEHLYTK